MTEQNTLSISELQQQANDGDAQAQFDLALCYAKGKDVEKNTEFAFDWHKKAAEQGHVNAQFALGLYYLLGKAGKTTQELINIWVKYQIIDNKLIRDEYGIINIDYYSALVLAVGGDDWDTLKFLAKKSSDADDDLAFEWLKKAARQDHTEANYWLGICYRDGIGTESNNELAFECYKKAAEEGYEDAYYGLALCYHEGKGIEQSNTNAIHWCEKAAEQNIAEAQYWLACRYFDGECVDKNNDLALSWLQKAAKCYHAEAINRLAECYAQGVVVEKSDEHAFNYYEMSASLGHAEAQYWLAQYYLRGGILEQLNEFDRKTLEDGPYEFWRNLYLEKGYERAFEWAEKSIKNGCGESYLIMGFMFAYGIGVEQDSQQAFEYFKEAEIHNHQGIADYFLAVFYAQGRGVKQSGNFASHYLQRAVPEKVREFYNVDGLLANTNETLGTKLLRLSTNLHIASGNFNLARTEIKKYSENNPDEMHFGVVYVDKAEELDKKNQELEEKNKQLQSSQIELEDMMSMFAHKFRSPLDAIIYNTTHENQVKLYTEAAQTMRGLLNIFSIISTDAEILKEKIKQDRLGSGKLATVFSKTLDMILLHLLSTSGAEKIQQHYMTYAKEHGQCAAEISYKTWSEDYFELEQVLQAEWEQSFALLLNQTATLEQRLAWLEQHFFKLELIGFERTAIQFKEYGITESMLTILLNEILVNAFKYYSSASKQPVVLEWTVREGYQVLICRNPSVRSERTIIKGSHKGHVFLSTLAHKTGSIFTKPTPQDNFVVEFGIPNELLISK